MSNMCRYEVAVVVDGSQRRGGVGCWRKCCTRLDEFSGGALDQNGDTELPEWLAGRLDAKHVLRLCNVNLSTNEEDS